MIEEVGTQERNKADGEKRRRLRRRWVEDIGDKEIINGKERAEDRKKFEDLVRPLRLSHRNTIGKYKLNIFSFVQLEITVALTEAMQKKNHKITFYYFLM